jgi:hypothetical protein
MSMNLSNESEIKYSNVHYRFRSALTAVELGVLFHGFFWNNYDRLFGDEKKFKGTLVEDRSIKYQQTVSVPVCCGPE